MMDDRRLAPDWSALHGYEGLTLYRDVAVRALALRFASRVVYLATPYSLRVVDDNGSWCPARSTGAAADAARWAWRLTRAGLSVVSPVMLAAQMLQCEYDEDRRHADAIGPLDHQAWESWCLPILSAAGVVAIPPLPGWDESMGVWREAEVALAANKPVCVLADVASTTEREAAL